MMGTSWDMLGQGEAVADSLQGYLLLAAANVFAIACVVVAVVAGDGDARDGGAQERPDPQQRPHEEGAAGDREHHSVGA